MVVSTIHINTWDSDTNSAVYACIARNKKGSIQSRNAFIKQGTVMLLLCVNISHNNKCPPKSQEKFYMCPSA